MQSKIEDAMRRDTAGPLGICRVCLPWGLRGGVLSQILFLIACRLPKAQEQFWEICLGGGGDQLSPIFREACPGGRQLSPTFWQRIYRACRLRRQARKGEQGVEKYRESFKKGAKKGQKWYPGGTWEPTGSDLEKGIPLPIIKPPFLGSFLGP